MSETGTIQHCDVFVLGGGPAGSTISALLAERGWDVVIVEKERHPRFHIGESLLPLNMPLLQKLGVFEEVKRIGMPKYGAEFNSPEHGPPVTFDFSQAWDKTYPSAFEVRRSAFDEILFRNAVRRGARPFEECRVTNVTFAKGDDATIEARLADGSTQTWRARFFVDASGRDTFLANRFKIKRRNRYHNSAAMFGHFTGAQRLPGRQAGNISMFWFDHGWFWFIPLSDGTTSVGAVCWPYYMKSRKTDPTTFFMDTIALAPKLQERLRDAKLTHGVTATGNFSYRADRMHGERYIMIGDAFAFIDPVFSSGVMLAMNSAFQGADVVDASLRDPAAAPALLRRFDRSVRSGVDNFSWFIYRMTHPTIRDMFMGPANTLRMQEAVLSLLAGDLFRGTPIHWSLRAFKSVYYFLNLLHPRRTMAAWRHRRRSLRERLAETPGT
ncbi:MAG TPA: NAD(P)/FAD-dependent oxidoreductase [Burkholderiales bacterium]|nr:NAD(P)/FAD-dependent oxidoreductase [Burkholderiales bacterium]